MQNFGLASITFAHPTTPTSERTEISLSTAQQAHAYDRLHEAGLTAFMLQTCLRVEVVCFGDESELDKVLGTIYPDAAIPATGLRRVDQATVHHLFRVAAGLDSPLVGEAEVLGQFRSALEAARAGRPMSSDFERILDGGIRAGRAARTMLSGTPRGSLAIVAVEHAQDVDSVAVVGAGAMASAVVSSLRSFATPPRITVYARRPDEIKIAADEARHISEVPEALAAERLVISATSAKAELFERSVVTEALRRRDDELVLIDLAMPPDFGPQTDSDLIRYYNVDDLAASIHRDEIAAEAECVVRSLAEEQWLRAMNHHRIGPVISGIMDRADEAVTATVRQFAAKLEGADDKEALVRQIAHTAVRRALHPPVAFLSSSENGASAAGTLAEAFGVIDAG